MTHRRHATLAGFSAVGLASGSVEVWIVPELGARIVSLRNLRTGREWCWHRPESHWLWRNQPGDPFATSTHAGIDECFPTVGACTHAGRALPDHGDVWAREWKLESSRDDEIVCAVDGPDGAYRFQRSVSLADAELRLDYRVENRKDAPLDFLWSLHPLLAIQPNDRIELGSEVTRVDVGYPQPADARDSSWSWPEESGARLDHLELPASTPGCAKIFAGPLRSGHAALVNSTTEDRLEFAWEIASQPWVGVWLTRGGYQNWHHLAIEPTNAPTDALADAPTLHAETRRVSPSGVREWTVYLRLKPVLSR